MTLRAESKGQNSIFSEHDHVAYQIKRNKANSTNLYPPTKGNLRETCKSQNINLIYLTLSSNTVSFRSTQTPVKYVLVLSSIKNILTSAQFQYLTLKPNLRGQDYV